MTEIMTIVLDLAKMMFQVHGADGEGRAVLRRWLRRGQVPGFFASLPPCLVGLEACESAHYPYRSNSIDNPTQRLPGVDEINKPSSVSTPYSTTKSWGSIDSQKLHILPLNTNIA